MAWPLAAQAQSDRIPRVALFMGIADDAEGRRRAAAFREALQQLGWKEGSNLRIHESWGVADTEVIRASAIELLRMNPNVIVVQGVAGPTNPSAGHKDHSDCVCFHIRSSGSWDRHEHGSAGRQHHRISTL